MRREPPAALTALLVGCAGAAAPETPPPRGVAIDVTVDARAGTLDVEVSGERLPARWRLPEPDLIRDLRCEVGGARRPLEVGEVVELPPAARALRWRYLVGRGASMRRGRGAPGGYTLHGRSYLGRPDPVPRGRLTLRFRGPAGEPLRPLLPWEVDARGVAAVDAAELWNPGVHTFGGRRARLKLNGGRLEVAILPGPLQRTDAELLAWLKQAATEVEGVHRGRFPHARVPVVLIPSRAAGGDVVPFGSVEWSTPQSVALLVRCDAAPRELRRDWVAVHELMHLTHPHVRPRTPWLSEGLATYYQMIARMRSGRRSRVDMWGGFRAGVASGRREARRRSLAELSAALSRRHTYMAVYWGGALLMLEADLAIRAATGGRRSLDDVVIRLLAAGGSATVEGFGAAIDAVASAPIWAGIRARHLDGPGLREGDGLFQRCGVRASGRLEPKVAERQAIERPQHTAPKRR